MSDLKCVCTYEIEDRSTSSYHSRGWVRTSPESDCASCVQLAISTKIHNDRAMIFRAERDLKESNFNSANPVIAQICEGCEEILWVENCQECCEHEFDSDEGYMCLNCDLDGADRVMSNAYEACEGER